MIECQRFDTSTLVLLKCCARARGGVSVVVVVWCFVVLMFCLRLSARSARDIWVSFVWIDWVLLREYSPADYADRAERNAAGCIITQRKTVSLRLRLFCGLSAWISEICGRLLGFHLSNIDWVLLREYSPADDAERNAAGCIITQRKTVCLR